MVRVSVEYRPRVRTVTGLAWEELPDCYLGDGERSRVPATCLALFFGLERLVFTMPLGLCGSRMYLLQPCLQRSLTLG